MSLWLRFLAHPVHSSQTAVSKDVAQPTRYRPGVRRDDMPSPMAVRLAADLRPSADGSAVRTRLSCRQPASL